MRLKKTLHLYRYDERENTWSYKELKNVIVSGCDKKYKLSDSLTRDTQITLRIIGDADADILPQDVVSFSFKDKNSPPDIGTFVVVGVLKNDFGSKRIRHTKVLCR